MTDMKSVGWATEAGASVAWRYWKVYLVSQFSKKLLVERAKAARLRRFARLQMCSKLNLNTSQP